MTIFDASEKYRAAGTPLIVLAGKEYGSGSSRDWAAKGPRLLGVRAVLAESFERIHRSNLVGMGILPLQFPAEESAETHGLTGEETFDIIGLTDVLKNFAPGKTVKVRATKPDGSGHRFPCDRAHRYAAGSAVLQARRHSAVRASSVAGQTGGGQLQRIARSTPCYRHPSELGLRLAPHYALEFVIASERRLGRRGSCLRLLSATIGKLCFTRGATTARVRRLTLSSLAAPSHPPARLADSDGDRLLAALHLAAAA